MFDLTHFTLGDMTRCAAALRKLGRGADSTEDVANRIVRFLHDHLVDRRTGARSCALVRFFKTLPFGELAEDLQAFAAGQMDHPPPDPGLRCLTLVATAGARPEWNCRESSARHRVIPLTGPQLVRQMPMVSQLFHQFGVETDAVLRPDPALLVERSRRTYNTFLVAEARGSPHLPGQDEFVRPFGIRSVLGFGGLLPAGDLFAVLLFAQVSIPRETAVLFQPLALSAKIAVLPFVDEPVFACP
jgi:hypothetical protein